MPQTGVVVESWYCALASPGGATPEAVLQSVLVAVTFPVPGLPSSSLVSMFHASSGLKIRADPGCTAYRGMLGASVNRGPAPLVANIKVLPAHGEPAGSPEGTQYALPALVTGIFGGDA